MLKPELPCQFVVTGSTHVLLQIAIDESPRNGIHLHNAVRLELPLDETSMLVGGVTKELANHFKVLESEVVTVQKDVADVRGFVNIASVDQVLRGVHSSAHDLGARVVAIYRRDLLCLRGQTNASRLAIHSLLQLVGRELMRFGNVGAPYASVVTRATGAPGMRVPSD
jgi:hypothetical protein